MNTQEMQQFDAPVWPLKFVSPDKEKVADKVKQCVGWLKAQGFDVLYAYLTPRNPRITIKYSPLCEQLDGAVRCYERSGKAEQRYWVAIRFGCEVRWEDRVQ